MTIIAPIAGALSMLANFAMFFGGGNRGAQHSPGGLGILGTLALILLALRRWPSGWRGWKR